MVGTAYFDGSGGKESPVVVVAGFFAPSGAWLKLERDWKQCLAWHGLTELHMKNFAHSVDQYASWKGDEKRRKRLLGDLLRVIRDHVDNSLAVAVLMQGGLNRSMQHWLGVYSREIQSPRFFVGVD